jgi:hypothetical protein
MSTASMALRLHELLMDVRRSTESMDGTYRYTFHQVVVVAATAGIDIPEDQIDWIHVYHGVPTGDFWTLWRAGKESLKGHGMSVFKKGDRWVVRYSYNPPPIHDKDDRFQDEPVLPLW